jgi:hypothetical protein
MFLYFFKQTTGASGSVVKRQILRRFHYAAELVTNCDEFVFRTSHKENITTQRRNLRQRPQLIRSRPQLSAWCSLASQLDEIQLNDVSPFESIKHREERCRG